MIRPRVRLIAALFSLALPLVAHAAEITEVADAADKDDPFDLEIEVGWVRALEQAKITRENNQVDPRTGNESIVDVTELRYKSVQNDLLLALKAGLYKDLELHASLPIVLSWEQSWRPAVGYPDPLPGLPENSTIHNREGICPDGTVDPSCAGDLFPLSGKSYRAGIGDGSVGLKWGILNDERDPYTATWTVGVDWTFPSGNKRSAYTVSSDPASPAAVGLKTNFFTFETALSKNLKIAEPFVHFYYRLPSPTRAAFTNCEDPNRLADMDADDPGVQNTCTVGTYWNKTGDNHGGYQPSHVGGFDFGAEFLPYVDPANFIRTAIQLSLGGTYVSEGRNFSELSDAMGRLTYTEQYMQLFGTLGLRIQASRYAKFHVLGTFAHNTEHLLTAESIGKDMNGTGLVELTPNDVNEERNPNYDFRFDQPGRRFRIEETTVFTLFVNGELNF